ncbi:Phage Tail Collar Domain protein [compost metagenome]
MQNEPAAFVPTPLIASKNLQDVPTPSAARGNLGVDSKTSTDTHAPAGLVAHFARSTAPTGWLKANGAAISRTAYASLFAAIGTTFGGGDGFNTFNLPDLRGEFLRGWDDGRGLDAGRGLGSVQGSQNLAHQHTGSTSTVGHHQHDSAWGERIAGPYGDARFPARGSALTDNDNYSYLTSPAGSHNHSFTTDASGGTEARPRNVAMLACIKY